MPQSRPSTSRAGASRPQPARPGQASRQSAPPPAAKPDRRGAVIAVLVVLVLVAGTAFLVTRDGDGSRQPAGVPGAGMAHVHALGVDPQDGALYAGTHYGLFRIPEQGEATLIAERVQDFMGFTVVGANRYLASGHPGEGQAGPSSLGLIESTDGGITVPLSLAYGIGRLGCLLAGDGTHARSSGLPWAIAFLYGTVATVVPVHPTQLYEALAASALTGLLAWAGPRVAPPVLCGRYLVLSGTARFLVEFLRINEPISIGLTRPQPWSALTVVIGAAIVVRSRRHPDHPAAPAAQPTPAARTVRGAP